MYIHILYIIYNIIYNYIQYIIYNYILYIYIYIYIITLYTISLYRICDKSKRVYFMFHDTFSVSNATHLTHCEICKYKDSRVTHLHESPKTRIEIYRHLNFNLPQQ